MGSAREEAVTVADLHHVALRRTRRRKCTCTAVLPHVDVILRIERDDAPSGRAARGMNADAVFQRSRHQPVGIGLPQVVLRQERKQVKVFQSVNVLRLHAGFVHLLPIVRHILIDALHGLHQKLALPCAQVLP